jgi:hypothetical protein
MLNVPITNEDRFNVIKVKFVVNPSDGAEYLNLEEFKLFNLNEKNILIGRIENFGDKAFLRQFAQESTGVVNNITHVALEAIKLIV